MNELARWFEREARRGRRAVYLEEALLGNRFWPYAFYRLRFFFARYVVASLTHAVTVLLLYRFFERTDFVVVLVAYAGASLVSNFWWGSLEAMRGEVRRLYRLRSPHLIPKVIGRWLSLSLQLTVLTALVTVVGGAVHLVRGGTFDPAGLYVVAIVLGLSLQFSTRAYHSGIYAIRRIYRPLPAIFAVEFVGLAVALATAPFLGAWCLPLGALAAVPTVAALTLIFTGRTYRFLGLSPVPFVTLRRLRLPPRRALRDLFGGGFSYALVSVDSLLVLVLFFATERNTLGKTGLFPLLFLLAPTVRAGSEWAQLMYFDLKRLEIRLFTNLRRRFERAVLLLALALGMLFSGVAILIGSLAYRGTIGDLVWVLVPFFVSLSLLAAVQIAAYSEGAYLALAANGAFCVAGFFAVRLSADAEPTTVLLLAAVAFAGFLLLRLRRGRSESRSGSLLAPAEWLAELRTANTAVRVTAARFYAADGRSEDGDWRREQVARRIARTLHRSGRATIIEPGLLAWYERTGNGPGITEESLPAVGGGLLAWVGSCSADNGLAGLRASAGRGLLGRELSAARRTRPVDHGDLRASFQRMFTSGIVFAPDEPIPARLEALPSEDKRAALVEAVAFARDLHPRRPRSRFHVTALCAAGELRLIFLVSRRAPRRLRERWEVLVRRANLRAAMGMDQAAAPKPRQSEPARRPGHARRRPRAPAGAAR